MSNIFYGEKYIAEKRTCKMMEKNLVVFSIILATILIIICIWVKRDTGTPLISISIKRDTETPLIRNESETVHALQQNEHCVNDNKNHSGSIVLDDNYRKPINPNNVFQRGGDLYPININTDLCDPEAAYREKNPFARGYYRYTCDNSGEEMKKGFNRFAGYITWDGKKENMKYCDLGMSPHHAPGCDWEVNTSA